MSRLMKCAAALLPLLAACAPTASLQSASSGPAVQGDGRCQAEPVAWAVGQVATEATLARVRQESGAGQLRPIAPGQATTRDLRPDRLNVFVDASNAIVRITCG
ncbi:Peptidase inhibitor I78 family protein [Xanthomonas sp. SS]|uniref:I78 family peptidase inhibitor n=1 Tax=Xanthomonas sp. SS TaxID=2724122 RepID=UPI00163B2B53|nr:I78 family peptidase inhibitor [Xanthomonas sp. SS]QNH15984.1 Peptidase inhibitor I78 family protein [Xanthomonas sp. SS]